MLNSEQRFESERHNIFTGEINDIALGSTDVRRIRSINLVETYAYGKKDNKWWTKKLCNNII